MCLESLEKGGTGVEQVVNWRKSGNLIETKMAKSLFISTTNALFISTAKGHMPPLWKL